MVAATGFESLDALVDATVPKAIRRPDLMDLGEYTEGMRESEFLTKFKCAPCPSSTPVTALRPGAEARWRGQVRWYQVCMHSSILPCLRKRCHFFFKVHVWKAYLSCSFLLRSWPSWLIIELVVYTVFAYGRGDQGRAPAHTFSGWSQMRRLAT